MDDQPSVTTSKTSRLKVQRQAQLDHYAAEIGVGLTAEEMRHQADKILQDAEDLDNGEVGPDAERKECNE